MNPAIKKFIETNIQLIEDNKWEEVYALLRQRSIIFAFTGEFTSLMLNANIDPLDYLNYIPIGYLGGQNITNFNVKGHLKSLKTGAFFNCPKLEKVFISKGVEYISSACFWRCDSLKEVSLPSTIKKIAGDAFSLCPNLIIKYDGTAKQWGQIYKTAGAIEVSFVVNCLVDKQIIKVGE